MDYVGEHLMPGKLGQFFVVLSFAGSLVATLSYLKSANAKSSDESASWKKMARFTFLLSTISIFLVFATIFYIVHQHYFEYNFAWEHSSKNLDPKYMLSCIWEAQEGSFLLWMMWNGVLGTILMFRARQWESSLLTIISFAQFCLLVHAGETIIPGSPHFPTSGLFIHSADAGWSKSQCTFTELLDGDTSARFISGIFIHTYTIRICSVRFMEEGIWIMDKDCITLDAFFLLYIGYGDHDGRGMGL
jgi:hypothetical protein